MSRPDQIPSRFRLQTLLPSAPEISRPLIRREPVELSHSAVEKPAKPPRLWPGLVAGLLLLSAAGGVFWQTWREVQPRQWTDQTAVSQARADDFLAVEAMPLLAAAHEKDRAAAAAALRQLDALFAGYAGGVDAFTHDLTGWGTRFKLIWRKGVETAKRREIPENAAKLVNEKFGRHVVSDARLEADVMAVLQQFAYDLEANRNELLGGLRVRLQASSLPVEMQTAALGNFSERLNAETKKLLSGLPGSTVAVGVGSLTSGIVAEEAVRQLVRVVMAQAAARMAGGALAGGGAAATAVVAGGAGGTAVAPGVGTAVGIVGGFLVGAVVDWWMTDKFEAEVKAQCLAFLQTTHQSLITGPGGLQALLDQQVEQTSAVWTNAVTHAVREPFSADPLQTRAVLR